MKKIDGNGMDRNGKKVSAKSAEEEIEKLARMLSGKIAKKLKKEAIMIIKNFLIAKMALKENKTIKRIVLNGKTHKNVVIKRRKNETFFAVSGRTLFSFDVVEDMPEIIM